MNYEFLLECAYFWLIGFEAGFILDLILRLAK
jgi:hypothetical protein